MKKFIAILLILCLSFAIVACGAKEESIKDIEVKPQEKENKEVKEDTEVKEG